jgi:nucleotide-binding universal stress UspA family protein
MASAYPTIAVASTFSPRFAQVLAEARRIGQRFGSELNLIYVGERTSETAAKFKEVLTELSLPLDLTIHYRTGDPAEQILSALSENRINMIIAGALEKEVVLHPFLGNVARRLVREAGCSVMLFTRPDTETKPFRKIVFVSDYSEHGLEALKRSLILAEAERTERLYVIRVITTFDQARASLEQSSGEAPKTEDEEQHELETFVLSAGHTEVPIEARCIRGNTGFAIADFVQSVEADLLAIPTAPSAEGALPANVAWITDVIPCNLWLIR